MAPPSNKRRKVNTTAVEEVKFDFDARADYLTGFHKRKVARIKQAQEQAKKKEKEERRVEREELRKQRKADLEAHVEAIHATFKDLNKRTVDSAEDDNEETEEEGENGEWEGIEDPPVSSRRDAEYVDEDQYATVTVEAVDITRDGFVTPKSQSNSENEDGGQTQAEVAAAAKLAGEGKKRVWTKEKPKKTVGEKAKKKLKKKKFRYESKTERKVTRAKERSRNGLQAKARREKSDG